MGVLTIGVVLLSGIALAHDPGEGCRHFHDGTNRINCNDESNRFIGTLNRDVVSAGRGNDEGDSLAGNDRIEAGFGQDVVKGSNGRDTIFGQGGNDTINGGNGADRLFDSSFDGDTDHVCAGRDSAPDHIDVADGDANDTVYADWPGEDSVARDRFAPGADRITSASDCPISE